MTGTLSGATVPRHRLQMPIDDNRRRLHDEIETRLFENPSLLNISITPYNCVFKAKEFPLKSSLNPTRDRYMPPPDLVYLYLQDPRPQKFHLVVLDVKPNTIGLSFANRGRQENRYVTYFGGSRGMWKHFIINDVKLTPMLQVVPEVNGEVYLSVGVVTKKSGAERYPILWHIQNERLGRMHNVGNKILYSK